MFTDKDVNVKKFLKMKLFTETIKEKNIFTDQESSPLTHKMLKIHSIEDIIQMPKKEIQDKIF